jgi:hypothetical protein
MSSRSLQSLRELDNAASITADHIPFPEIAVELGVSEHEVLRWAKARARGRTFRSSPDYVAYALAVERRYRLFDWALYSTSQKYRDGIFRNARSAVA